MITYRGIIFANYELFNNYRQFYMNQLTAQNAATQLQDLANNIPLAPGIIPTCAYSEASFLKSINAP